MPAVLITGGTGLIGTALQKALLAKGYQVIVLSRNRNNIKSNQLSVRYSKWDIKKHYIEQEAIRRADYIIHLAGANVANGRWTKKRKKEIEESRVLSGALLVKALHETENNVKAVLSASAIGWYGPDPVVPNPQPFKETHPSYNDFLGTTCKSWEQAIHPVSDSGRRLVILRTGIVLSRQGGAYTEFRKPLNFGLSAILGNGKQMISWIHIDDLVRLYITAIENKNLNGVYNAVAPFPVNNEQLMSTISEIKKGFSIPFRIPEFALRIVLGEMSTEVLKSTTVSNEKIVKEGFDFLYPDINSAIRQLEE